MKIRGKQLAAVVLGVALLGYLVYETGPATVMSDLRLVGPGLVAIIALELMVDAFNTVGWWYTFRRVDRRRSLGTLFLVRLAGSALNHTLPAASMGGEPAKVMLLRPYFPVATATASVVTAKVSFTFAKALFITAGMVLAWRRLELPVAVSTALFIGFLLSLCGVFVFLLLQLRGFSSALSRFVRYLSLPERWAAEVERASASVDEQILDFYRSRPSDFARSILSHMVAFCFGVAQVSLLLGWLGLPKDWLTSLAIEAFSLLLGFVTFVVPGSIGVQEGGKVLIFTALGLPAAAGLSVGIAFRLNAIVGAALGLAVFTGLQGRGLPQLEEK